MLIDGGHKEDAEIVGGFLAQRKIDRLSHVVCTHPHDDHSGGLIELLKDRDLKVGRAWMHIPENHVNRAVVDAALSKSVNIREASIMRKSLNDADDLQEVLRRRGTPISEPFEGDKIGFLTVCGPSQAYYKELVGKFENVDEIKRVTATIRRQAELLKAITDSAPPGDEALLDEPEERPINNSSAIQGTKFEGSVYLFTADAGQGESILIFWERLYAFPLQTKQNGPEKWLHWLRRFFAEWFSWAISGKISLLLLLTD